MTRKKLSLFALLAILLLGCKEGEQNYQYVITNKTTMEDSLTVVYHIEGSSTYSELRMAQGDSVTIAQRDEVPGKGVWDIETSVNLYKVDALTASNTDRTILSEELSFRKKWKGPEDINGIGVYQLDITDEHLVLSLQNNYTYAIKNELQDTIFSTSHLKLTSGENMTRSADTILPGEIKSIGSVDIYTYDEGFKGEPKYKTQKMTGLSTIFFLYKEARVEMNLAKDTVYFETGKDTCTLIVNEAMPQIEDIINPKKKK